MAAIDYNYFTYKMGQLYTLLRNCQALGLYQGEHTITWANDKGESKTVHLYIDGTSLEMEDSDEDTGLSLSINTKGNET